MDYLTENVAVNLKRIRQSKGMSLDQASEQTGVSKSMLSQIEKGTANPSLGVLGKITSGLRIEFQELIATPLVDSYLVTPENLVPTKELEGQYTVWTCFPCGNLPHRHRTGRNVCERRSRRENKRVPGGDRRRDDRGVQWKRA